MTPAMNEVNQCYIQALNQVFLQHYKYIFKFQRKTYSL